MLLYFVVGSSTLAAIFGLLAFLGARSRTDPTEKILLLVHEAFDRVRSLLAEQNRGLREELTNNLRGFQTASLQAFTDLGRQSRAGSNFGAVSKRQRGA